MTESDAYAVMLLQAFESPLAPPWLADDSASLTLQARALVGEHAEPQDFVARRARLGLQWLADRLPSLRRMQRHGPPVQGRWIGSTVLLLAALAGALGALADGAPGRGEPINLLAPPLFALLGWNLLVYAVLLVGVLRFGPRRAAAGGWLRSWLLQRWTRLQQGAMRRLAGQLSATNPNADPPGGELAAGSAAALARFAQSWWRASMPLQRERLVLLLHLAAVALALGALASLYARGLVVDIRAGWSSTFLGPAQVRVVLDGMFGPAAALLGIAMPDAAAVAALRLDGRSMAQGDSAARWIHLIATTVALVVLLPRLWLAALAALRLRRLVADFPLPADDGLERLMRSAKLTLGQAPVMVSVLPYSYHLSAALQAGLALALDQAFGPGVVPEISPSLPLGAEDELARWLPQVPAATVVALFALTATPEAESHGAFLRALGAALHGRATLQVMVDESGFRARFPAAGAGTEQRLVQRRLAWQQLLQALSLRPVFVDLARGPGADGAAQASIDSGADPAIEDHRR